MPWYKGNQMTEQKTNTFFLPIFFLSNDVPWWCCPLEEVKEKCDGKLRFRKWFHLNTGCQCWSAGQNKLEMMPLSKARFCCWSRNYSKAFTWGKSEKFLSWPSRLLPSEEEQNILPRSYFRTFIKVSENAISSVDFVPLPPTHTHTFLSLSLSLKKGRALLCKERQREMGKMHINGKACFWNKYLDAFFLLINNFLWFKHRAANDAKSRV